MESPPLAREESPTRSPELGNSPRRQESARSKRSGALSARTSVSSKSSSSLVFSPRRPVTSRPKPEDETSDFERRELLASGTFGAVYLCSERGASSDKKQMIDKTINLHHLTTKQRKQFLKEIAIGQMCSHPNVVTLHGFVNLESKVHMYMAYERKGNLAMKIAVRKERQSSFEDKVVLSFLYQMISGVAYLHRHKIVHGNLKPTNVLLAEDEVLKITDAGMACLICTEDFVQEGRGSPAYLAPEVISDQQYNRKCDTWSLGVIGYELVELHLPYRENGRKNLIATISEGTREPLSSNCTTSIRDIINAMLQKDLDRRPSCSKLMRLSVFQKTSTALKKVQPWKQLAVIVCQWKKPLRTFIYDPANEEWNSDIQNMLNDTEEELTVDNSSSVVFLPENGALVVDAMNRQAFRCEDIRKGVWVPVEAPRKKKWDSVGVVRGGVVCLIGGADGAGHSQTVDCFNLNAGKWSQAKPLPNATHKPAVVTYMGDILAIGGGTNGATSLTCIQRMDDAGHWRTKSGVIGEGNTSISACEFRGEIIACLKSAIVRLHSRSFHAERLGDSPGLTDSMTSWGDLVAIAKGQQVWTLQPEKGRLNKLPKLPLEGENTRTFIASLT